MNLKENIKGINDFHDFRQQMVEFFANRTGNILMDLSPEEISEAGILAETKFRTWEWNYAYGPEYHFSNRFDINEKLHFCQLFVKDGIIHECDMKGSDEMFTAGKKLIGCSHMPGDMREVFRKENFLISPSDILKFF
jgi:lipoate-protein ligase A